MTERCIPLMAVITRNDFETWIPIGTRMTIVEVIGGKPVIYSGVRIEWPAYSDSGGFSDKQFFFMQPDDKNRREDIHAFNDRNINVHRNESFVFRYAEPALKYVEYILARSKREWKPPVVTPTPHNPAV